jgi:hypothetical protein
MNAFFTIVILISIRIYTRPGLDDPIIKWDRVKEKTKDVALDYKVFVELFVACVAAFSLISNFW